MLSHLATILIITLFLIGYIGIILEHYIQVNKTAVGIAIAGGCWMIYFLGCHGGEIHECMGHLTHHLSDVSQIIFFLLGAMTLVELIDSHKGFTPIIRWMTTRSKRKLMILITIVSFFLSAVLDNLTTTILMISILRKLIPESKDRLLMNCLIVIAANSGGAWTPIGDVTTTMLWIEGRISTLGVMKEIFLPSVVSVLIPLAFFLKKEKGLLPKADGALREEQREPGGRIVLILGVLALLAVPVIKGVTGLPPFMGMMIGLSILWLVTDIFHFRHADRDHLRVAHVLKKIDLPSVLFFLGILLAVDALQSIGILKALAQGLDYALPNPTAIASVIGVISAIIDNVPLVAATMGMYDLAAYPQDAPLWLLIAFTAGTGGSMLSIGSAAGVALMGLEKIDFITYLRKATIPAALGYAGGILSYILITSTFA